MKEIKESSKEYVDPYSELLNEPNVEIPDTKIEPEKESEPITVSEEKQVQAVIKNANGEDVPIYAEGPSEFIEHSGAFTNAKLAYENMELSRDPNVQKVFKFNEKEGMGWLAFYDMDKKEEIKGKGTVYNIEQLFPFEIDKQNGLVNTVLQETFPLLYTDEEPSEKIKADYERLKKIEASKTFEE